MEDWLVLAALLQKRETCMYCGRKLIYLKEEKVKRCLNGDFFNFSREDECREISKRLKKIRIEDDIEEVEYDGETSLEWFDCDFPRSPIWFEGDIPTEEEALEFLSTRIEDIEEVLEIKETTGFYIILFERQDDDRVWDIMYPYFILFEENYDFPDRKWKKPIPTKEEAFKYLSSCIEDIWEIVKVKVDETGDIVIDFFKYEHEEDLTYSIYLSNGLLDKLSCISWDDDDIPSKKDVKEYLEETYKDVVINSLSFTKEDNIEIEFTHNFMDNEIIEELTIFNNDEEDEIE